MEELRIYFQENPLLSTQGNNFTIGYIATDGSLTAISNNDPNLTIVILEPSSGKIVNNNSTIIVTPSNTNITLRLKITYSGYTQYFSFVLVPNIPGITLNDIYNRFVNLLPQNVYTKSINSAVYADNLATATVLYQLYNNSAIPNPSFLSITEIINNFYPISAARGWEYFLTGSNRLLYQDVTQYGELLQHIYRLEINNDTNPYWLAFNISKYIYLWLNKQKYVYISESIIKDINDAFILNQNTLGNCIITNGGNGSSYLVIVYVCTDGPAITTDEQTQINAFVRQIMRAGMAVQVVYTESLSDLGLTIYLGNTYHKDPRQGQTYCIAYNQNVLNEALGYVTVGTESITDLISYELTLTDNFGNTLVLDPLSSNSLLLANSPYKVTTISTNPVISGLDSKEFIQYYSSDDTALVLFYDGVVQQLTLIGTGSITLSTYLGTINNNYGIIIT